jgi:hypothetical protein
MGGEQFVSDCIIRHSVFAFGDSPLSAAEFRAHRAKLHLSRHQRRARSCHRTRISAFCLCLEFRWCREKTLHNPPPGDDRAV